MAEKKAAKKKAAKKKTAKRKYTRSKASSEAKAANGRKSAQKQGATRIMKVLEEDLLACEGQESDGMEEVRDEIIGANLDYYEERARKTKIDADRAEVKLLAERKEVLDASAVEEYLERLIKGIRKEVDQAPKILHGMGLSEADLGRLEGVAEEWGNRVLRRIASIPELNP